MTDTDTSKAFRAYVEREDPDAPLEGLGVDSADTLELLRTAQRAERDLRALSHALRQPRAVPAAGSALEACVGGNLDGRRFGRFTLRGMLGRGGLSTVYLAHDPQLGREVALKLIEGADGSGDWLAAEARALAQLEHPGVVRVFEVGEVEGHGFIAMERVRGHALSDVLAELRRQRDGVPADGIEAGLRRTGEALRSYRARALLVERLARALGLCHDRGVLHRDIKPSNVIVTADLQPILIDFGLAHLRAEPEPRREAITHRLVGTPVYLAPEQIDSDRTGSDPRSDQFALGSLAYELLTLTHPFAKSTTAATLAAISCADAPPPSRFAAALPRQLDTILGHVLRADPEQRYPVVAGLAHDLRAFAEHRPLSLPDPSAFAPLVQLLRRHRAASLGTAAVVAAVALTLLVRQVGSLAGERARLLTAVARVEDQLQNGLPDAFVERGHELRALRQRTDQLGARSLGGTVAGAPQRQLASALEAYSADLERALQSDRGRAAAVGVEHHIEPWNAALALERELLPLEVRNLAERQRGRVRVIPPAGFGRPRLLAQLASTRSVAPFFTVWHETGFSAQPSPGSYRLVAEDPRLEQAAETGLETLLEAGQPTLRAERDWLVEPHAADAPPRVWRMVAPDLSRAERWVRLPEQTPERAAGSSRIPSIPSDSAWIDRRVTTVADLMDWMGSGRCAPILESELLRQVRTLDASEPARLLLADVERYAAHRGRRLPTPAELIAAFQQRLIEPAIAREGRPTGAELTSGRLREKPGGYITVRYPAPRGGAGALDWSLATLGDLGALITWVAAEAGTPNGLARPASFPDRDADLARQILEKRWLTFRLAHGAD